MDVSTEQAARRVVAQLIAARTAERQEHTQSPAGNQHFNPEALLSTLSTCSLDSRKSVLETLFSDDHYPLNVDDALYSRLQWVDLVFDQIEKNCRYEPVLLAWLMQYRLMVGRLVLLDETLVSNPGHPVRGFFFRVSVLAVGWTSGSAGLGKKLQDVIQEVLSQVERIVDHDTHKIFDSFNLGASKISDFLLLANRFEKRVCEVKVGELRAAKADALVTSFLNKVMGGKRIPAMVVEFVQGPWRQSMRVIYLKCGNRSIEWTEISKLTITLICSVVPQSDADRKRLYRIIPKLPNQIKQILGAQANGPMTTQEFLDGLDDVYVSLLKNEPVETVEVEALKPQGNHPCVEVDVSKRLKIKLAALCVGQWYKYTEIGGEVLRLRLALKMEDIGQLLFVNIEGRNALHKSFESVAYYLALHQLVLLEKGSFFELACQQVYQSLEMTKPDKRKTSQSDNEPAVLSGPDCIDKASPPVDQHVERAVQDSAGLISEASGQELSAQNGRIKTTEQKDAELEAKIAEVWQLRTEYVTENKTLEVMQKAKSQVDELSIGSWIVYVDNANVKKRCKLAVKLRSTDKLIFVDRDGVKVLVCRSVYLIAKVMAEEVTFIDVGPKFESALEKVVGGLRDLR